MGGDDDAVPGGDTGQVGVTEDAEGVGTLDGGC